MDGYHGVYPLLLICFSYSYKDKQLLFHKRINRRDNILNTVDCIPKIYKFFTKLHDNQNTKLKALLHQNIF